MYEIAVIEDVAHDRKHLDKYLDKFSQETGTLFHIDYFSNADDFLEAWRPVYDLVFMDIDLPHTNGMDAAKRLRAFDPDVTLIFVTSLARYAVSSYEVSALDYILKPVSYPAFRLKMQRAVRHMEKMSDPSLTLKLKDGIIRLKSSKIKYIEVQNHQLRYHTEEGLFETRGTMKETEQALASMDFARCNNCYLVNLHQIKKIRDNTVYIGDETLTISRPRKKLFLDTYASFLGN